MGRGLPTQEGTTPRDAGSDTHPPPYRLFPGPALPTGPQPARHGAAHGAICHETPLSPANLYGVTLRAGGGMLGHACSPGVVFPRGGGKQLARAAPRTCPASSRHPAPAAEGAAGPCAHREHRPHVRTSACLRDVPVPAREVPGGTPDTPHLTVTSTSALRPSPAAPKAPQ